MAIALVLYYVMLTFVARPYLIPSESMEPTLHGCSGCVGDRIMVDKMTYDFSSPEPGDVIVFKGPPGGTSATSRFGQAMSLCAGCRTPCRSSDSCRRTRMIWLSASSRSAGRPSSAGPTPA